MTRWVSYLRLLGRFFHHDAVLSKNLIHPNEGYNPLAEWLMNRLGVIYERKNQLRYYYGRREQLGFPGKKPITTSLRLRRTMNFAGVSME